MSQVKTLAKWMSIMAGPRSVLNAARLLRSGRHGGDDRIDAALPLRARSHPLTIYARPGTDDLLVFLELFLNHEYDAARTLVSDPISSVLDLGSNIGCSIAYFSRLFPAARFVGVEPSTQNLAMATRTLAPLIQAGQVTLVHGFAGAHPRQATLARAGSGGSNELILADGASSPADQLIPVITVQHIIEDQKLTSIDLLKCDIEGSEAELFSDCAAWIGRVRWIVVELHNDLNDAWLVEQLQKNGAAFSVKQSEPKSAGCSVAWLRRNE